MIWQGCWNRGMWESNGWPTFWANLLIKACTSFHLPMLHCSWKFTRVLVLHVRFHYRLCLQSHTNLGISFLPKRMLEQMWSSNAVFNICHLRRGLGFMKWGPGLCCCLELELNVCRDCCNGKGIESLKGTAFCMCDSQCMRRFRRLTLAIVVRDHGHSHVRSKVILIRHMER